MPNINDIAKEAHVSHGTVSNVLNGRGNVSVEKIKLVYSAAEKLGYKINEKAQELRQGTSRKIALILPDVISEWCAILYEELQEEMSACGYAIQLYSSHSIEITERKILSDALTSRVCAVIASSCIPGAAVFYRNECGDLPVVLFQQESCGFPQMTCASFQYEKAGREIAAYVRNQGARVIGILTSEENSFIAGQFLGGVRSALSGSGINVRTVFCPEHQIDLRAFDLFDPDIPYDYMICTDYRRMRAVKNAHPFASRQADPHYIALAPHSSIAEINHQYYSLDYKMMAHRIAKTLIAGLRDGVPLPPTILSGNIGFPELPAIRRQAAELNMLTVASPASTALSYLLPQLETGTGIRLHLSVMNLNDIYEVLNRKEGPVPYDLIRMDMAWMDELAPQVYLPLGSVDFDWDSLIREFRPEFTKDYITVRGERYCLPYDPSTQILFYRKDLFENPIIKRMYFEATKCELAIPETFEEYNRISRFFTQNCNPQSPVKFGTTVAIGNAMVSASEYCVRLFGMGGDLFDENDAIALNTPEGLAALKNYQEAYEYSDRTQYQWWKNALQGFAEGSSAMTIVFMNHAPDILNLQHSQITGRVGYARVPGSRPIVGGGVIGIVRSSGKPELACSFLKWLYSAPIASVFTILGGLSPCQSVYNNRDVYEKYPWLSAAKKSFPIAKRRRSSSRYGHFSQFRLEQLLSYEVKNAVMGICTPEDALARAQAACCAAFDIR